MRKVQLDQNANERQLAESCNEQGQVECRRFPKQLQGESDAVVVQRCCEDDCLLLSFDRTVATAARQDLRGEFPGITILSKDDHELGTMTTKHARQMLAQFKADFPHWHTVNWRNSVVEIRASEVIVEKYLAGVARRMVLDRRAAGWVADLEGLLR